MSIRLLLVAGAVAITLAACDPGPGPEPTSSSSSTAASSSTTSSTGGAGGSSSSASAASSSSTSSTGGAGGSYTVIGAPTCSGTIEAAPPAAAGALAAWRVHPPAYPWHVDSFEYRLATGGACTLGQHEVLIYPTPVDVPPDAFPVEVQVQAVSAPGPVVVVAVDPPIIITEGELMVAVQRTASTCVETCADGADPNSYTSAINAGGSVDDCPAVDCPLVPLAGAVRWQFRVTGHQ